MVGASRAFGNESFLTKNITDSFTPTLLESGDSFPLNSTHLPILTYLKREEVIVVVAVVVVVVVVEEEEEA